MQKLHPKAVWLFFIQYILVFVFGFGFAFGGMISALIIEEEFSPKGWMILGFSLFIIFWIVFSYVWARLTYRYWKYELTEDAVKIEKGVIWKKYISIPYERIQNVDIYRGILARILRLSDLHIQTAGYGGYTRGGATTEGRLPGLDIKLAEQLREELIKKVKGRKQGL